MNKAILTGAILALMAGLWAAWSHFQGVLSREGMVSKFGYCTLAWFVLATWWNYRRG